MRARLDGTVRRHSAATVLGCPVPLPSVVVAVSAAVTAVYANVMTIWINQLASATLDRSVTTVGALSWHDCDQSGLGWLKRWMPRRPCHFHCDPVLFPLDLARLSQQTTALGSGHHLDRTAKLPK